MVLSIERSVCFLDLKLANLKRGLFVYYSSRKWSDTLKKQQKNRHFFFYCPLTQYLLSVPLRISVRSNGAVFTPTRAGDGGVSKFRRFFRAIGWLREKTKYNCNTSAWIRRTKSLFSKTPFPNNVTGSSFLFFFLIKNYSLFSTHVYTPVSGTVHTCTPSMYVSFTTITETVLLVYAASHDLLLGPSLPFEPQVVNL